MTKVSPMLAEALGLPKTQPEPQAAATVKPKAPAKPAAKPATTQAKVQPKTQAKASAKPAAAKPARKSATKTAAADKKAKQPKPPKVKMERDSFTMPKDEYAKLAALKARLQTLGQPAKKSELLRAGVMLLAAMSDNTLKATLAKVPAIKTGRPKKK